MEDEGWAEQGYTATDIAPTNQGACYLIAEGGIPALVKAAYLSNADIIRVADYAAWTRRTTDTTAELRAIA